MDPFSALLALCAGNHRSLVNSPHKSQWRQAVMFSLICKWTHGRVNNRNSGELRPHRVHYDVTVMSINYGTHFTKSIPSRRYLRLGGMNSISWAEYHHPYPDSKVHGANVGPTCRPQMGPMLVPWILLSGYWRVDDQKRRNRRCLISISK